ncbi:MAG: helix-turn-helix domain-containing protein [Planctomycetota bacterium]
MKLEIDLDQLKKDIVQDVIAGLKPLIRQQDQGQEKDFSVETLAEHLDIPIRKVYEMTSRREIPFYKVGNKLRFRPTDIAKWKFATYIPDVNGPFSEKGET